MKKWKQVIRRLMTGVLSVLMVIGTIPVIAFAADGDITISFDTAYTSDGTPIRFQQSFTSPNGVVDGDDSGKFRKKIIYGNGEEAYCIEPGIEISTGDVLSPYNSQTWTNLRDDQKNLIKLAMSYGKPGNSENLPGSGGSQYIATQILVWEIVNDWRIEEDCERTDDSAFLSICSKGKNAEVGEVYDAIVEGMKSHSTKPSFLDDSYEMEAMDGRFKLILEDINEVIGDYDIQVENEGVEVEIDGDTLVLTSDTPLSEEIEVTVIRTPRIASDARIIDYGNSVSQSLIMGVEEPDTVSGSFRISAKPGSMKITKESEDGKIEDVSLTISGNGMVKTVTTGEDGTVLIPDLMPGMYQVMEHTADYYLPQQVQQIEILPDQESEVLFSNKLKRGTVTLQKQAEDGLVENIKFRLSGVSISGVPVEEYGVTDQSGKLVFDNILMSQGEGYTLEEVEVASRYVIPESKQVSVAWNENTSVMMNNRLKKFRVTGRKIDGETNHAQGDGSLSGAEYGLYLNGEEKERMTTDASGCFTSGYHPCGTGWTIKEIKPSEGYLLDETVYPVDADTGSYQMEYNQAPDVILKEQAVKGQISIIKHMDDGSTQIETPEEGAVFQIYLTAAGSYEEAKEAERDQLICDKNGYAISKMLPYGTYTVCQTDGADDTKFMSPFQVYISKNQEVYPYIINNSVYSSYLKILKTDKETGKTVMIHGAGFQIYDASGEKVTMSFTYPSPTTIDTFYVNDEGYLITPQRLMPGDYTLVEVQAPHGYVLDQTPIPFKVEQAEGEEVDGLEIIQIIAENMAQKAVIKISKKGETFASVEENQIDLKDESGQSSGEEIYHPIYEEKALSGAVYQIIAAEDIITGDGTVRHEEGNIVEEITTGEDGVAISGELYLGKYEIREVKAPDGYVMEKEGHQVELNYAGQDVTVTETEKSFHNVRQKALLHAVKFMEQDNVFRLGTNGELLDVAFGLYAEEDIQAADGQIIPKDGLIEIGYCKKDGTVIFDSDLPFGKYYLKEMSTDSHYVLSKEKHSFEFSYAGQEIEVLTIPVNQGQAIVNELKRGRIEGIKLGIQQEEKEVGLGEGTGSSLVGIGQIDRKKEIPLEGALFGLYPQSFIGEYVPQNALLLSESDQEGKFVFEEVAYGDYVVVELKAPDGYRKEHVCYYLSVTEEAQIIQLKVYNEWDVKEPKPEIPEDTPKEEKEEKPDEPKEEVPKEAVKEKKVLSVPQTGDDSNVLSWLVIRVMAVLAFLAAFAINKGRKKK